MRELIASLIERFKYDEVKTWWGHGIQGFLFGLLISFVTDRPDWGVIFTIGAFLHREVEDYLVPWLDREPDRVLKAKFKDGFMDLLSPYIGAVFGSFAGVMLRLWLF